MFFITGKKVSETQNIDDATESISTILKEYIPPAYSPFFVAGYPDVVSWFMDNYDDGDTDNIYFKEFNENIEKYMDKENKMNFSCICLLRSAYKKSLNFKKYECSF